MKLQGRSKTTAVTLAADVEDTISYLHLLDIARGVFNLDDSAS